MKTCNNEEFLNECSNKIWLVGTSDKIYNQLFNNEDYKKISQESFENKYEKSTYVIIQVEKEK